MTITVNLSNIQAARDEIKECESWIIDKARQIAGILAREGRTIAEQHTGDYTGYIRFDIEEQETANGSIAILTMSDNQKIIRRWWYHNEVRQAIVSPSLMAEYGSGQFAVDGWRGTFPGQTHAWQDSWYWTSYPDNKFHRSSGEKPTRPMHTAYVRLQDMSFVSSVIERVFNG